MVKSPPLTSAEASLCFNKSQRGCLARTGGMLPAAGACMNHACGSLSLTHTLTRLTRVKANMSSNASLFPLLCRLPPISLCKNKPFAADPSTSPAPKFQVFCSPEWRHPIGRGPINHAFSRTPPPIQPLASLFQCVYYTAEHKGDTRLHMHWSHREKKQFLVVFVRKPSKRSTCPRERYVLRK